MLIPTASSTFIMEYCLHGVSTVYECVRLGPFSCYATTTLAIRNFAFELRITKYCVNISRIVTNVINVKSSFFSPSSDAWKCFSFISYIQRSFAALQIKLTTSEIANEKTHDEQPNPHWKWEWEWEHMNVCTISPSAICAHGFSYFITFIMYRDKFDNFICYLTNGFSIRILSAASNGMCEMLTQSYNKICTHHNTKVEKKRKKMIEMSAQMMCCYFYIILLNVRASSARNEGAINNRKIGWFFVFISLFFNSVFLSLLINSCLLHFIQLIVGALLFFLLLLHKFITKFHKIYLLKWNLSIFGLKLIYRFLPGPYY